MVELYLHCALYLHGIVLNYTSKHRDNFALRSKCLKGEYIQKLILNWNRQEGLIFEAEEEEEEDSVRDVITARNDRGINIKNINRK
jgi:hypothetical protein